MKLKKTAILTVLLAFYCFAGVNMSGRVSDIQNGQGIAGATVSIVGTGFSSTTDSQGNFTISNVPAYSTGFQFKASKTGYVDTYTQLGNSGEMDANDITFPLISNTLYGNLHNQLYGGIAHTSGKADIFGRVGNEYTGVSGVVITARYIDNNANAGTIRYVNASNMPDGSLTSTSSNGVFIAYNVDPYRPIKITGTKAASYFSSCVAICYPDKVTVGGIEQVDSLLQLSGKVGWDENPVSGVTVSIPGTLSSTTTGTDGSFNISFNPVNYGVLKFSKSNYVDTYFSERIDEDEGNRKQGDDEEENEFFIIPQTDYTGLLNQLGRSHINGKGDIVIELETINEMNVAGAKITLYDKNGTKLNPDILYFDEEGMPATGLNETTSESQCLILNLDPGYYFIAAEKSGCEFSRNTVFVFANGITSAPRIIGLPPIPEIIKAKAEDIPSANISKSAQNVPMLAFMFHLNKWETDESVIFDSIIVTAKGTGNISTALSSAKLYLDADNNGTYETEVSTGTISGNKITFKNINKEMDIGLNQRYQVVFNFNGTASIGQTFGVDILKNADVYSHTKNTGISVTCDGWTVEGNLMTIAQVYPPSKPSNFSPANGATQVNPLSYVLQSSPFNPGQGSNVHSSSQWMMWKDGETEETFTWDSGTNTINLTSVSTPVLLEGSTKYWWKVRHQNGDNIWSDWSDATYFTTAQGGITPAGKPSNQSPEDGQTDVPLPVVLTGSQFSPGNSVVHAASQWQIYLDTKNVNPVFDSKRDGNNLTSITVSGLSYNTQYLWRVRYQDGNGAWSQWSEFTSFETKEGMKGDLNHDAEVDIRDVILCLRMAIDLDPVDPGLADMNEDGQVDILDVILILRKAIDLD
ncbi:MAG: carboxypeptidase-like regulatory domain-containing protein [Candidatus Omnitrophica bacterium]|nr:carboxypeptidase-like regulatory domain-containing protein [Candidatus Omnitrophota bacterium]